MCHGVGGFTTACDKWHFPLSQPVARESSSGVNKGALVSSLYRRDFLFSVEALVLYILVNLDASLLLYCTKGRTLQETFIKQRNPCITFSRKPKHF